MTTDTSRDAVEALGLALHVLGDQAEIADNGPSDFATTQHTAADTLAALLDEREAAKRNLERAERAQRVTLAEAKLREEGLR